jgi:hypothetical protein
MFVNNNFKVTQKLKNYAYIRMSKNIMTYKVNFLIRTSNSLKVA